LTHGHQDHVGGLTAILKNFCVSRLILGRETAAPAMEHLKALATSMHIPIEHAIREQHFRLGWRCSGYLVARDYARGSGAVREEQ